MFLYITFAIAFFNANKFLHKTVEALNDGVFQVRTFFDNPKTFFEKDNSDTETESNYDIPKDANNNENYNLKESEDFKSKNDYFIEIEKNSPNSNDIENEQQQNKIEINDHVNENSQNQKISQNDQNKPQKESQELDNNIHSNENLDSQSQENITEEDKHTQSHEELQKESKTQGANVNDKNQEKPEIINHDQNQHESINKDGEQNHLNQEAEENQGKAKSQINENNDNNDDNDDFKIREYPHLESYIYEIKSATQVNPPPLVGKMRSFLKSIERTSAGKMGEYWEINGNEANFTFRFKPNLVRGIRLYKTNRPCEIYKFQVVETTRDYIILDDSYLKYPIQQFMFPIFIQTEELKLKVLKTQNESKTVCLFNYSLLTV